MDVRKSLIPVYIFGIAIIIKFWYESWFTPFTHKLSFFQNFTYVFIKDVVELTKWGGDSTPIFLTHEHVYFTSLDNDRGPISSAFFERDSMNENELSISL